MVVPHGLRCFKSLLGDDRLGLPCGSFSPSHPIFLACREKCYFPLRFVLHLQIGLVFPPIKGPGRRGQQGGWKLTNGFQAGNSAPYSCPKVVLSLSCPQGDQSMLRRGSRLYVSETGALFIPKLPTLGKLILWDSVSSS